MRRLHLLAGAVGVIASAGGCALISGIDDLPTPSPSPDATDASGVESSLDAFDAHTETSSDAADSSDADTHETASVDADVRGEDGADGDGAPVCSAGTYVCAGTSGNVLRRCASDGSGYADVSTCGGAALCDATAGRCDTCVKSSYFCTGKTLHQCSADGATSSIIDTCATPELCAISGASGCVAPTCTAGAKRCTGKTAEVCNPGETAWTTAATCKIECSAGTCSTVQQLISAVDSTCVLLSDANVYCWGGNYGGNCGQPIGTKVPSPTLVPSVSNATQITLTLVSGGARLSDGTVMWWGQPDPLATSISPAPISGLTGVVAFAIGYDSYCAKMTDASTKCWGKNDHGQLGDGTTTPQPSPTAEPWLFGKPMPKLGGKFGCDLLAVDNIVCWGANGSGQVGNGTTTDVLSPSGVITTLGTPLPISTAFAVGQGSSCIVDSVGQVWCWGGTDLGGSPVTRAVKIAGLTSKAVDVAPGPQHSCAILDTGGAMCWGSNFFGELGDGTTTSSASAVAVKGLSGVVTMSAGGSHTCAATTAGDVVCWGYNANAQLGDGTTTDHSAPAPVVWP